jgi:phosphate acetyltransferase
MKNKSLYIASMEPKAGKLLVTLGIMDILTHHIGKVAFFRPVVDLKADGHKGMDNDIELIRSKYCPEMDYSECYGFDVEEVKQLASKEKLKDFYKKLLTQLDKLYKKYDFVLCEGLNSSEFISLFDSDINLNIAKNLNIPFIGVINAKQQSVEEIQQEIKIAKSIIKKSACTHFATFINRISLEIIKEISHSDKLNTDLSYPLFYLPEVDEIDRPSLADIKKALNASNIMGSDADMYRVVRQIKIATMTIEHFLSYIEDGDLIIVGGDRADILLASLTTLTSANYPNIARVLITARFTPEKNMLKL